MKVNLVLVIGMAMFVLLSCKNTASDEKTSEGYILFDFEEGIDKALVKAQDASYEWIKTDTSNYLKVNSGYTSKEPGVVLKSPENQPWDLNGKYAVKADVTNLDDKEIQVEMFVGNDPDGLIRWYCSDYLDLKPGQTRTITVPLAWSKWVHSPQLGIKGMRGVPGQLKTDIAKIQEITINTRYSYEDNAFAVDNIRAEGELEVRDTKDFKPFIDEFGMYKHDEWPGKMHSVEELKQAVVENSKVLEANPGPQDRSIYGGWAKGPKLEATGFFRTEKIDGKWWMVDPEGYLFWSAGVNCVDSRSVYTGITGREDYFEGLPKNEGEYAQFYIPGFAASHGFYKGKEDYEMFNFYQLNLYKKYGDEWLGQFQSTANDRLHSWGLNTIGFVSDEGAIDLQKTPYVGSIWITDTPKIEGSQGFWGKFHDVFDPQFNEAVRNSVERQKKGSGDPWCIGFFIDNELSWGALGSLSVGTLQSPASQAAKQEFVADLMKKYDTVEALNSVWGTQHGSWDALLESTEAPDFEKAEADLLDFYEKIADTYFKTVHDALDAVAPGQNYLGCRFAWKNNAVVLGAGSKYLDIMSFNKYEYGVANVSLPEGVDAPILIGEFHFGATDRGYFHLGVKAAKNQEHRGVLYEDYIESALKNPLIIGAHWFQYLDQPLTGRFDGENYNVGLVDEYDNPH
ncbi:MAG: beta-agarase, partial [Bacteroidota bacterium]